MPDVQFPAVFNLANLNGLNGFVLNGQFGDLSGWSVSAAGDVNGDEVGDLLIGAPGANSQAGRSYVVFGKSSLGGNGALNLATLDGTNGFVLNDQEVGSQNGWSVSTAGDINGDGVADLLIGARYANSDKGRSYVVFGKTDLGGNGVLNLSTLNGTNGFMMNGQAGDLSGWSVSAAGDVNGDGVGDLLIGAPGQFGFSAGRSYVVFGKSGFGSIGTLNLDALNGLNGFVLNGQINDQSGTSVSMAGDINSDGIGDLLIGAPGANSQAGRSYIVFGKSNLGASGVLNLGTLNGANGFVLNGQQAKDNSGSSLSAAGDVNNDGVADLLIGAPGANSGAGRSYVLFGKFGLGGKKVLNLGALNGVNGFVIDGQVGDRSGTFVRAAGDINGDGVGDILVGTYNVNSDAGYTYAVLGESDIGSSGLLNLGALDGTNGFVLNGQAGDRSGISVSGVGDVNNDGVADFLIGAPAANTGTGRSYVAFGDNATFVLHQNQLTIAQGQTQVLDNTNLNATSIRWPYSSLGFQARNVLLGYFESLNNPNISITSFTQNQINQGQIAFVYIGNYPQAPSYDITVTGPGLAIAGPYPATITLLDNRSPTSSSKASVVTLVGGTMAGLLGTSVMLGLSALYFRTKAKEELDQAIETSGSGIAQQSDFHKKVFYPVAKKVYEQIKISGFLGHLGKQTAKHFVTAIQALLEEMQRQSVDLDFEKMSSESQQQLFKEIVKQIRLHTISQTGLYLTRFCNFFKAEVEPVQIEDKANAIASAIAKNILLNTPLLHTSSQAEMTEHRSSTSQLTI